MGRISPKGGAPMRRRWVLVLVLAVTVVSLFAGYYARTLRDDNPTAADCEAAINYFDKIQSFGSSDFRNELISEAGANMRDKCTN